MKPAVFETRLAALLQVDEDDFADRLARELVDEPAPAAKALPGSDSTAFFARDPESGLTTAVTVFDDITGTKLVTLEPVRDSMSGLMVAAQIHWEQGPA